VRLPREKREKEGTKNRAEGLEGTEEDHLKGKLQEGARERNEKSRRKCTPSLLLILHLQPKAD